MKTVRPESFLWLNAAALLLLLSCSKSADSPTRGGDRSPTPNSIPAGEYVYVYTGFYGAEDAVRGWISLSFPPEGDRRHDPFGVTGSWELDALVDPDLLGPQVGKGKIVGYYSDESGSLRLNFTPDRADDNVYLIGSFDRMETKLTGTWSHDVLWGTRADGTFYAVRL